MAWLSKYSIYSQKSMEATVAGSFELMAVQLVDLPTGQVPFDVKAVLAEQPPIPSAYRTTIRSYNHPSLRH